MTRQQMGRNRDQMRGFTRCDALSGGEIIRRAMPQLSAQLVMGYSRPTTAACTPCPSGGCARNRERRVDGRARHGGMVARLAAIVLLFCCSDAVAARWTVQPVPLPPVGNGQLVGVSCVSGTRCMAVGYFVNRRRVDVALGELWNGRQWSIRLPHSVMHAFASRLASVSCTSAAACTAVGYAAVAGGGHRMLVEAWDGKSWQVQSTPSPPGASASSLSGVSCIARPCVAVGWSATSTGQRRPLVERRRGTTIR